MHKLNFAAHDLSLSRGSREILSGVSLEMSPGEVVVLRGPNGAGKTTLLRAFAGLLKPDSGRVSFSDVGSKAVISDPTQLTTYCGVLNAHKAALTVSENLKFWAALYRAPKARIAQAREAFGLDRYQDYHAGALSTGLARRLGLARLIISARPIWLVDEPTSALDDISAAAFVTQVDNHRQQGGLTVIATHNDLNIADARKFQIAMKEPAP